MPPTPSPRDRKDYPRTVRELRRQQIIAAARSLVARQGLAALTISALEQKLNFSRGVITYHFRNKEEIVHALLESAVLEIDRTAREEIAASLAPEARIRASLEAMVKGFLDHQEAGFILLSFWGRIAADKKTAKINAALYRRYRNDASALLQRGVGSHRRARIDAIAALMVGAVIGIVTQVYFDEGSLEVEACLDEAARMILAGLHDG